MTFSESQVTTEVEESSCWSCTVQGDREVSMEDVSVLGSDAVISRYCPVECELQQDQSASGEQEQPPIPGSLDSFSSELLSGILCMLV